MTDHLVSHVVLCPSGYSFFLPKTTEGVYLTHAMFFLSSLQVSRLCSPMLGFVAAFALQLLTQSSLGEEEEK